jgi:hypothetical protein
MQTNKIISAKTKLYKKGNRLLKAAHEYWEEYQKECGPAAVVWLDNDNGHFVLFTRSEYKKDIIPNAILMRNNLTLDRPFEKVEAK